MQPFDTFCSSISDSVFSGGISISKRGCKAIWMRDSVGADVGVYC